MPDDADERPNVTHTSTRTTGNAPVDEIDPGGARPKKKGGDGGSIGQEVSTGDRRMLRKPHGPQAKWHGSQPKTS